MIDNRTIKESDHEIDEALGKITDTEILLNFQKAISSLYPHLIPIYAFAYDSWDDIVEPLFFEMVYNTFAFKYGVNIKFHETHTYMITLGSYRGINHIECIPKQSSFDALVDGEWIIINECTLVDKVIIFKSFGDGEHFLTGGLEIGEAYNVGFDLVEADLVSASTGIAHQTSIFINKGLLHFECVLEN